MLDAIQQTQQAARERLKADRLRATRTNTAPKDATEVLAEGARLWADRFFITTVVDPSGLSLLANAFILNLRSMGTVFSSTRLRLLRFTAKNLSETMPDITKMRPFSFTPLLGILVTLGMDLFLCAAFLLVVAALLLPVWFAADPIGATTTLGAELLHFIKF